MQNNKTEVELSESLKDVCTKTEEKNCFIAILDQLPFGIVLLDKACNIEYCNETILGMSGYQDAELFKQNCFHTVFPVSLKEKIQEICKELHGRKDKKEFEQRCIAKDGKIFLFKFKTIPVEEDEKENPIICYIEDVSKCNMQINDHNLDSNYVKMIEDANDGIVLIQDKVITRFNNNIAKITGYQKDKVIGKSFLDFVSPAYKKLVLENYVKRMEGKEPTPIYEIDIILNNGKEMPMEIITYVIEFNGRAADMIVLRDISKRKEAEKKLLEAKLAAESAEKKLETVLYNIISGVILVDAETHQIVDVNPIAEQHIGLPKEKIVGNVCHNFICPTQKGKCPITDLGLIVDRSERVLINKDGTKVPVLKSAVPVNISGKNYIVESFVDLTKMKEAEKSLIESKIAAETANRTKSEFLATMSHELRTPLNSIIGFSDLIMGGGVGEIGDMQKKFLGNISTSGKHLLSLINNVLDISKIEAGKMELNYELFSAPCTIDEVKQLVSPLADKKGIKIELFRDEHLDKIYADRIRFKQILFNLASNAIKFTPQSGKITISSHVTDSMAQFTVTDRGIGISEENKSKLFQPFIQLDSASNRKYEGTGLGLSLVKQFVELHHGRIWFESELGKGTSFTFELPLQKDTNAEATAESVLPESVAVRTEVKSITKAPEPIIAQSNAGSKIPAPKIMEPPYAKGNEPLILIVEDDDASRELLEVTLVHEGYRVASAASGKEALELAREMKPFAITLDIMMPGMDGWDVLRQLKEKDQTHDIPVIMTSMVEDRKVSIVWGAVEHFIKPIHKEELLGTLSKIKGNLPRSPLTVLAVDDERSTVELIAAMLRGKEFNVLPAYGGQEAIDIAFKQHPDVIVLDLMMPEVSGFDVIKALKTDPATIDTPIIICTAKELDKDDRKALDDNVTSILKKGMLTRDNLIDMLKALEKRTSGKDHTMGCKKEVCV